MKISNIKESDFDEKTVTFLKNFTLNAKKNFRQQKIEGKSAYSLSNLVGGGKKKDPKEERQFYDLKKLWLIFQEQNKVSIKVKDLALNSLIEIL